MLRNEYRRPFDGFKIIFEELPSQNCNFAIASPLAWEIAFNELSQKGPESHRVETGQWTLPIRTGFKLQVTKTVTEDSDYKKLESPSTPCFFFFLHQISVRRVFNFNVRTFFYLWCSHEKAAVGGWHFDGLSIDLSHLWACVKLKRNATRYVWLIVLC